MTNKMIWPILGHAGEGKIFDVIGSAVNRESEEVCPNLDFGNLLPIKQWGMKPNTEYGTLTC